MQMRLCCYVISALLFLIGAGLIAAGLVVIYKIIPDTVRDEIIKEKPLGNNNQSYNDLTKAWMDPSYVSHIQYWFYDYVNVNDILNRGAKPAVRERGPYGYREVMANANISFYDDGILSYQQYKTYIFDPSVSCANCTPEDKVTVPDLIFFTFIDFLTGPGVSALLGPLGGFIPGDELSKALTEIAGYLTTTFETTPFTTQPVKDLLFDEYKNNLFTKMLPGLNAVLRALIEIIIPGFDVGPDFLNTANLTAAPGLFDGTNGTGSGIYFIKTGQNDIDNTGQIIKFFGPDGKMGSDGTMLSSDWWNNPDTANCPSNYNTQARMINGTSGDFFKPFITKEDVLHLYVSDICRSMYLTYDKDVSPMDIDGYRFVIPQEIFNTSKIENCGFCHTPTHQFYAQQPAACLPSGLLDVSHCQPINLFNQTIYPPIAVSNPHFLYADDFVANSIYGITPSYENDYTYLDIEPTTGTVLAAQKRLQINVMAHNYPESYPLNLIQSGAYPLIWINETFSMDQKTRDDLYDALIAPQKTGKMLGWIAVGIGITLIVISAAILVVLFTCAKNSSKSINRTPNSVYPSDK